MYGKMKHTIRKYIEWVTVGYINPDHSVNMCKDMAIKMGETGPVPSTHNYNYIIIIYAHIHARSLLLIIVIIPNPNVTSDYGSTIDKHFRKLTEHSLPF